MCDLDLNLTDTVAAIMAEKRDERCRKPVEVLNHSCTQAYLTEDCHSCRYSSFINFVLQVKCVEYHACAVHDMCMLIQQQCYLQVLVLQFTHSCTNNICRHRDTYVLACLSRSLMCCCFGCCRKWGLLLAMQPRHTSSSQQQPLSLGVLR